MITAELYKGGIKLNQIMIMDKASFYKLNTVKEFIEHIGYVLMYLPAYSSYLNQKACLGIIDNTSAPI